MPSAARQLNPIVSLPQESEQVAAYRFNLSRTFLLVLGCLITLLATPSVSATAEELIFGPTLEQAGWTQVNFPGIPSASFRIIDASTLEITTDAAAGILWRALESASPLPRLAHWRWRVDEGVPPTDLTRRGADDRALGLYFVFGTGSDATKGPMALLRSSSVSALVYVFGGDKSAGEVIPSPHMGVRGKFVVLRPATSLKRTWFDEHVDLHHDHVRAFGRPPPLLLAVAIFSDSDDTHTRNRVRIKSLVIER
jgi:Protein of unknown function (DUF3047)